MAEDPRDADAERLKRLSRRVAVVAEDGRTWVLTKSDVGFLIGQIYERDAALGSERAEVDRLKREGVTPLPKGSSMAEDPSMQKNAASTRIERHTQELWKHSIVLLRADERAKIVALLRKQADAYEARGDGRFLVAVDALRDAADTIEQLFDHEPPASASL